MTALFPRTWSGQQDSNLHQVIDIATGDSDIVACNPAAPRPKPPCDSDKAAARERALETPIGTLTAAELALLTEQERRWVTAALARPPVQWPFDDDAAAGGRP